LAVTALASLLALRAVGAGARAVPPPPALPAHVAEHVRSEPAVSAPLALVEPQSPPSPSEGAASDVSGTPPASAAAPREASELASGRPAPAAAEIRVVVIPFGEVWLDGKPLGHAPISVKLAPGAHEVGVGDGRPEQRHAVHLHAGEREHLVYRRGEEAR
jgi:hypothetical protein